MMASFGTLLLYTILVSAAVSFGVSIAAGTRPRLLRSARLFAYATAALIVAEVAILAYAFLTNDFAIRYVHRYSDRSMSPIFLLTALWGGQDGSLLWWLFLLALYSAACIRWLRGRYLALQPYIIATLMSITMFFAILMAFSANPFETYFAGAPADGKGLNPMLQNFYMIIHPPSLYIGFIGCSVPFAFAIAALVSGRLHEEWLWACRRWILFAWVFLSLAHRRAFWSAGWSSRSASPPGPPYSWP